MSKAEPTELELQVHAALWTILKDGPRDCKLGICANVSQLLDEDESLKGTEFDDRLEAILTNLFKDWPNKSFSVAYPIGNWTNSPSNLFWNHHDMGKSMWNRATKYGAARWELLEYCVNQLENGQ